MVDQRWLLSRRALLGGVGALGVSALLPRGFASRAQAAAGPATRFVVVHVPEGMWNGAMRPAANATTFGPIFEAMDPFKAQILALSNLNMQSRDHGPGGDGHHRGVPHMLTGTEMADENNAGGISVDQKIAQAIGGDSKFGSLQFAVRIIYNDTNSRLIWSAAKRSVPAIQDPWEAYKRIFTGVMPTAAGGGGTTSMNAAPPAPPKIDLRKSALDYALSETASLRMRLSGPDRDRLDSYQESLRDIEKRLGTTTVSVPGSCTPPTLGQAIDKAAEANYPKIGKLQMDLMVAALQCNLTRVATLQWGNSNDQCTYSWLGVNALGHDLAHNNGNVDPSGSKKQTVFRWYSEQAAYLLGKLQSIPEGTGTMLDNTLILWVSEFSESNGHTADKLLWFLMGNANGYFKQGRVVNCGGRSTNDVHASICNAFGIADTTFGNPAYCKGAIADLR